MSWRWSWPCPGDGHFLGIAASWISQRLGDCHLLGDGRFLDIATSWRVSHYGDRHLLGTVAYMESTAPHVLGLATCWRLTMPGERHFQQGASSWILPLHGDPRYTECLDTCNPRTHTIFELYDDDVRSEMSVCKQCIVGWSLEMPCVQ